MSQESSIAKFINDNAAKAVAGKEAQKKDEVRLIVVVTREEKETLENICKAIGAKQIAFASELLKLALSDANKAFTQAQNAAAPVTPPAPTAAAEDKPKPTSKPKV